MGREKSDTRERNSSIALLQERFRQLQKAKEMREQRELLRLLSGSEQLNTAFLSDQRTLLFHPGLILQRRWSNFLIRRTHYATGEMMFLSKLDSRDGVMNRRNNFDDSDVDTSLHL